MIWKYIKAAEKLWSRPDIKEEGVENSWRDSRRDAGEEQTWKIRLILSIYMQMKPGIVNRRISTPQASWLWRRDQNRSQGDGRSADIRESRDKHILCSMYKFGQRQTDIEGLEGFFDVYAKASTSPILNSRISTPLRPGSVLRTLKPKQVYWWFWGNSRAEKTTYSCCSLLLGQRSWSNGPILIFEQRLCWT